MEKELNIQKNQVDLCDVCSEAAFKYRCPGACCTLLVEGRASTVHSSRDRCGRDQIQVTGCSRRTCSLACCKAHKERFECAGKRQREIFVSAEDYKEETMMSDYRLLEEMTCVKDSAERARTLPGKPGHRRAPRQMGGVIAAAKRAGVTLKLMSEGAHDSGLKWLPSG
jgi:hypothetical protein